jgi:hypothetical protein
MDFRENFEKVNKWYDDIKREYAELYPKMDKPDDRKAFLAKFKKTIDEIRKEIDSLNATVVFLQPESMRDDVYNQIRTFELYADELESTIANVQFREDNFNYKIFNELKDRQKKIANINFEDKKGTQVREFKKEAIQEGDRLYGEAKMKLDNTKELIRISKERLQAINEEIRQQNYKLLEIDELIKQSQSLFVRAGELVKFFSKTFLKSKIMNLLIGLMLVMCIGCVVLIIMQKSSGGSATAATTNTTATNKTALIAPLNIGSRGLIADGRNLIIGQADMNEIPIPKD